MPSVLTFLVTIGLFDQRCGTDGPQTEPGRGLVHCPFGFAPPLGAFTEGQLMMTGGDLTEPFDPNSDETDPGTFKPDTASLSLLFDMASKSAVAFFFFATVGRSCPNGARPAISQMLPGGLAIVNP